MPPSPRGSQHVWSAHRWCRGCGTRRGECVHVAAGPRRWRVATACASHGHRCDAISQCLTDVPRSEPRGVIGECADHTFGAGTRTACGWHCRDVVGANGAKTAPR